MEKLYNIDDLNISEEVVERPQSKALQPYNGISFDKVSPQYLLPFQQTFTLNFLIPQGSVFYGIKTRSDSGLNWIEITDVESDVNNYFTATFEITDNYSNQRVCDIIIYADNMSLSAAFKIIQLKGIVPFSLPVKSITLDSDESNGNLIPINTKDDFNPALFEIDAPDPWISTKYDANNSNIILGVEANDETTVRTGEIYLTYEGYTQTFTVYQNASPEFFTLSKEKVILNADGTNTDISNTTVRYTLSKTARIINIENPFEPSFFNWEHIPEEKKIVITAKRLNLMNATQISSLEITVTSDYAEFKDKVYTITVEQPPIEITGFTPKELVFDADGNPLTTDYTILDLNGYEPTYREWGPEYEFLPDWYKLNATSYGAKVVRIEPNNEPTEREFTEYLICSYEFPESELYFSRSFFITIKQLPALPLIECGIWKDTYYQFEKSQHSKYQYYRLINKDYNIGEIYRGRLFFINDVINIKINDIARNQMNYLKQPLETEFTDNNGYVNLQLQVSENGVIWDAIEEYHFFNNYSYKDYESYDNVYPLISTPILNYLDSRQYFITSFQDYFTNKDRYQATILLQNYGAITSSKRYNANNSQNTVSYKVNGYDNIYIAFDGFEKEYAFEVRDTCNPYCLYYMNKNGGWNWMLFNNGETKTDQITTYNYNQNAINSFSDTFANTTYLKEYKEQWKLSTPLLNDEQSRLMEDIYLSPVLYLHILDDDKIIAVNIVDKTWQQKTFKGNRRKPYFYTFNVENSQNKIIA